METPLLAMGKISQQMGLRVIWLLLEVRWLREKAWCLLVERCLAEALVWTRAWCLLVERCLAEALAWTRA